MRALQRFVIGLTLAIGGVGQAQAAQFSSLYVFGDSLVDAGNAFIGSGGTQAKPADGYFVGRFSNGLNFADYLSIAYTGSPTSPLLLGGNNVGVGGALAQSRAGETSPSFLAQIGAFTAVPGRSIPADALVLVTFGGNDVRATALTGGAVDFSGAGNDLTAGLSALYTLGARNFILTGVPDIGLLPSAQPLGAIPGRLAELTSRSEQFSDLLRSEKAQLDAEDGTNVTFFDLFSFEHDVIANPTAYGLPATLDTSTPCQIIGGGSPQLTNCANSLYFDGIHPTTQIHQAIANAIVAQVAAVPEPESWLLMIGGSALVGVALRRRRNRVGWRRAEV